MDQQIGIQRTGSLILDPLYQQITILQVFDVDAEARIEGFCRRLSEILERTVHFIAAGEAHNQSYAEWSEEKLEWELGHVMANIEALRKRTTEDRLRNVRVIGCTTDVFIGRFRDSAAPVDHIFLDEACYTPVIKALTLFRRNIQVTLLGDHKQLPPVCEMPDDTMQQHENRPCVLWAKSAVFAKDLFSKPLPLLESLFEHIEEPLPSGQFHRATLTRIYRFGQNLALLLDELVYDRIGFTSVAADGSVVSIEVISVARVDSDKSNENECRAARDWIRHHGARNLAILAPYRNQVAKLCDTLSRELHDDVLTVHRSQGREWDTVVLSATDTMGNPFLTNTQIPKGKLVMNTALSRARKSIVLVCDAEYWSGRGDAERQLLSRLIRAARH